MVLSFGAESFHKPLGGIAELFCLAFELAVGSDVTLGGGDVTPP
jgi:hypothetical protein